jgi:hypothetical protein
MAQALSKAVCTQPHRFLGSSNDGIVMGGDAGTSDHDASRLQPRVERADPHNLPQSLNRHWYGAITGGMPLRWYIVAVCCGTIVILLGWYPWGILLVLLSLPHDESPTTRSNGSVPRCPLDTGAPR